MHRSNIYLLCLTRIFRNQKGTIDKFKSLESNGKVNSESDFNENLFEKSCFLDEFFFFQEPKPKESYKNLFVLKTILW